MVKPDPRKLKKKKNVSERPLPIFLVVLERVPKPVETVRIEKKNYNNALKRILVLYCTRRRHSKTYVYRRFRKQVSGPFILAPQGFNSKKPMPSTEKTKSLTARGFVTAVQAAGYRCGAISKTNHTLQLPSLKKKKNYEQKL